MGCVAYLTKDGRLAAFAQKLRRARGSLPSMNRLDALNYVHCVTETNMEGRAPLAAVAGLVRRRQLCRPVTVRAVLNCQGDGE